MRKPRSQGNPRGFNGMDFTAKWPHIEATIPDIADPMERYVEQIAVVLRPRTAAESGLALRVFATYLIAHHPDTTRLDQIGRPEIEGFKTWLASRKGKNGQLTNPATMAHRLGNLRMFFLRIDEWGWPEAPARVPMFHGDVPKQHHALPKALDDPSAAKLLRAAQADKRMLVGLTVEFLLRTGLRIGEYMSLTSDAIVLIGDTHWLHVPVGKLHEDRYLPLHPHLVELVTAYRDRYVPGDHPLLLPRENGTPQDRFSITRMVQKSATAAGIGHVHPHQLRHALATQAINRGMSIEAIAAMLGHKSLDMTLVYAKIANRTVAEEYFQIAEKVDALYTSPPVLPADDLGPNMARLNREHHRLLGNGYCIRPKVMDCEFENICETCTFFQTGIEFRPILLAQHNDACAKGQTRRMAIYDQLITEIDTTQAS
ncbi:tyrosine-type recombinase/integrase [Luteococcus sanguinis]|uniref:Tyrosine-type recombinase/integrase n=1 Tax=Luteococcus sanguinis TaxID=174038 RepID=A0ABW1X196_9ACTN